MPRKRVNHLEGDTSKKARKANWTSKEVWMLLEEVKAKRETIMSPLTNDVTNKKKQSIWETIADKLTAVCANDTRTATNVREKWGCLKSEAVGRRDMRRRTGGAPVKQVEYDQIVWDILGEGNAIVDGINVATSSAIVYLDMAQDQPHTEETNRIFSVVIPAETGTAIKTETVACETVAGCPSVPASDSEVLLKTESDGQTLSADKDDMQPFLSSTVIYTPENEPEESNADGIATAENVTKVTNRRLKGLRKMWQPQERASTRGAKQAPPVEEGGALWDEFLKSEIERNKSDIECNNSKIERNKEQTRLLKLQAEKLQIELKLLREKNAE